MRMNGEKWSGLIFLVLAVILFWDNEHLKTPTFDLLGSKFFPRITCLAIILLSILLLIFGKEIPQKSKETEKETPRPAILFLIMTAVYFLALEFGLGFLWTTIVYLTLFIFLMNEFQWKAMPKALGIAAVSSYSFYYFFEKVLLLLLP